MKYIESLRPIVEQAGQMALALRAEGLVVTEKPDGTPVSNADKAVSEFLTRELLAAYPLTKVVSEEHPDVSGVDHPLTWVIDPIDGTKKYVAGRDIWCVMVALFDTAPVASIIYYPEGPVWYWAERGEGAFFEENGLVKRVELGECGAPVRLVQSQDFKGDFGEVGSHGLMKHMRKLLFGKLDAFARTDVGYWDLVPPMLIAQEAGALVTDFAGDPIVLTEVNAVQDEVLLSHPEAFGKALDALRQA